MKTKDKIKVIAIITAVIIVIGIVVCFILGSLPSFDKKDLQKQYFKFVPDITIGELLNETHQDAYGDKDGEPPLWGETPNDDGDYTIDFDGENIYDGTHLFIEFSEGSEKYPKIESYHIGTPKTETTYEEFEEYIKKVYKQYKGEQNDEASSTVPQTESTALKSETTTTKATTTAKVTTTVPEKTEPVTEPENNLNPMNLNAPVVSDFVDATSGMGDGITIRADWTPVENAYGYEMQIITTSLLNGSSSELKVVYDTFYETGGSMSFGVSLRVRAFSEVNGRKYYSNWSNEVAVKDLYDVREDSGSANNSQIMEVGVPVLEEFAEVTSGMGDGITIRANWTLVENAYGYEVQILTTSFDGTNLRLETAYDTFYETGGSMPFGISLRVRAFSQDGALTVYGDWSNEISLDDIFDVRKE